MAKPEEYKVPISAVGYTPKFKGNKYKKPSPILLPIFMWNEAGDYVETEIKVYYSSIAMNYVKPQGFRDRPSVSPHIKMYVEIPEYMRTTLAGRQVSANSMGKSSTTYAKLEEFPKRISGIEVSNIFGRFLDMNTHFKRVLTLTNEAKDKCIFIKFDNHLRAKKSRWNGADLGTEVGANLSYFVGYRSTESGNYYDNVFKHISVFQGSGNPEVKEMEVITWTEEREKYFNTLSTRYASVNDDINTFMGKMTEETIDTLIANTPKLLSNE